jgi:benzoylformate decarboxylase
MLYQAYRGHAPLVVIASTAGVRYEAMDSQMAADLVGMARPVTKWAVQVNDSASVLRVLRRAVKIAATPPMGPVFVSLPADMLDVPSTEKVFPAVIPSTRVVPQLADIEAATAMLAEAKNPIIIMGDGVAYSDGEAELTQLAELLGAEVWGADNSEMNIRANHPLYKGNLGHMFGFNSSPITRAADAILIVGTYIFPEVYPLLAAEDIFAPDANIIHIDLNAYEIAKNFAVDLGLVSDPKLTLAALTRSLEAAMTASTKETAKAKLQASKNAKEMALQAQYEADEKVQDNVPLETSRFMKELSKHTPEDVVIFDEALTSSPPMTRYLPPNLPRHFFQTRGGSLGVGIPGALGLKLAYPDKTVIGFTGDGGSMYTIQALWTAAHHNIGAKFVVCNNQSYMLLKLNIMQYWKEQGVPPSKFPESFDLERPVVDFAKLSESMGVPATRVEKPEEVEPAIKKMLETDGPYLIDMVVSSQLPSASSGK